MKPWTLALIAASVALSWSCGGSSSPASSTAGTAAPASSSASSDLVDRAKVDSCAGFNVTKAAELLGVPATELEVSESFVERLREQQCRYWSKRSRVGPGIEILLNVQESSAAASRILDGQRSVVPVVDSVPERGPALLEFTGMGDEAFWDTNTGGVNVRVRNIVATIHASTSSKSMSDRDPGQIEVERRVAEEIARGLSS